jgi:hypothetical protein
VCGRSVAAAAANRGTYQDKGKTWRYPVGTTIVLGAGSRRYFLSAYGFMGNDLRVKSTAPCIERQRRSWAARHNLEAEAVLSLAHGRRTTETIRLAATHLDAAVEAAAIEAAEAADTDASSSVIASHLPHRSSLMAWMLHRFDPGMGN